MRISVHIAASNIALSRNRRGRTLKKSIAVIGAGISGVTIARSLTDLAEVTVFEKSTGLGGRMAQRRVKGFGFDHGAQYFTARDQAFREVVGKAMDDGAVILWPEAIASLPDKPLEENRAFELRFAGAPAMNGLAAYIANDMAVMRETEIVSLQRAPGGWHLIDQGGLLHGPFDLVVSSAPGPQTAKILPSEFNGQGRIASARMSGCFTLMVGTTAPNPLPFTAARVQDPILGWVAVDSSKPGRNRTTSLVIHSRNAWAETYLDANRHWVKAAMLTALSDLTGHDFSGSAWTDLHRWRFANVEQAVGSPYLLDIGNGLAACGDWCLGNRVEAAFESGRSLGEALREWVVTG
jgi:renalase